MEVVYSFTSLAAANSEPQQISVAVWALLTAVQGGLINGLLEIWSIARQPLHVRRSWQRSLGGDPGGVSSVILALPARLISLLCIAFLISAVLVMFILVMLILHHEIPEVVPNFSKWKPLALITGVILLPLTAFLHIINKTRCLNYLILHVLGRRSQHRFTPGWISAFWYLYPHDQT